MKYYLIILFFFLVSAESYPQADAGKEYQSLKKIYGDMKSISFDFIDKNMPDVRGNIIAKKGNKFILDFANRKIFCDGATIWNYSHQDKNVIVSKFDSHSNETSIETIFFSMMDNHKPISLNKTINSAGNKLFVLELEFIADKNNRIILEYYPDNLVIASVTIINNYVRDTWIINNLKLNTEIADDLFVFKANDKIEIIDLR
jgi:outer membrane lipoprotein-sorting protein